ncbi:MAG: type IV pilus assembly protein PilM [Candidatus Pacebacteria bacterium]|nr:type IV pilus assembly protein PilM [Candidatus Paceibacterota bacterium]
MEINLIKKKAIGFDISDLSVKAIGLERKGKDAKIFCFGCVQISKGAIEKGEIKDEKSVKTSLEKLLASLPAKKSQFHKVAVSLPEEKSFVDVIKVPILLDQEKLQSVVSFEAENVIPFPLAEVYFDFEKIETTAKLVKCQEVLLSACPQKIVDTYFNVFNDIGITPSFMEVESFSVARALTEKNFFSSPTLIIDFGETRTTLAIFAGKNLRFTSTINSSSGQLTKSIATFLGISPSSAEELKKKEGIEGKKEIFEATIPFLNDMAEQINHYIDYYRNYSAKCQEFSQRKSLNKILLCGAGANLKGLVKFLSTELNLEVEKADPLINLSNKTLPPKFNKEMSLSYATAIGLAIKLIYGD